MFYTMSRNKSRDAIQAGNSSDIRIHGLKGNMNQDQPWTAVRDACRGELCNSDGSSAPAGHVLEPGGCTASVAISIAAC